MGIAKSGGYCLAGIYLHISIKQSQKMKMKNWCILVEFGMDMVKILQGLGYKLVCSTTLPRFFAFGLFILVFKISAIIHQQLVTCYATRTYEIRL